MEKKVNFNLNSGSLSTLFTSKMKTSTSKSKKRKKSKKQEITPSPIDILTKKIVKEIINNSIQTAEIHIQHKKYQKSYENRPIKKEQNFITFSDEFYKKFPEKVSDFEWCHVSKIIGQFIYIKGDGNTTISDFKDENKEREEKSNLSQENDEDMLSPFLNFNLNQENNKNLIISSLLYEHEQRAECKLFLLYSNFTLVSYDLLFFNKEYKNYDDINEVINESKFSTFDFKPYLNIPNIDTYIPNLSNNIKLLIFPKILEENCTNIIVNFSQIAGKFLIFDTLSNSIVDNYLVSAEDYVTTEKEYLSHLKKLINTFLDKIWSIKQYECLCQIINNICTKKNSVMDEYKKLALLLNMASNDEDDNLELIFKTNEYTFTEMKNLKTGTDRHFETEKLFSYTMLPIISKSNSENCLFPITTLLNRIKIFFDKLYDCSMAVGNSDLSLVKGRFKLYQILFLKCYNRGINLHQLFMEKDPNNYGYVNRQIVNEIFQNLPIGINDNEIEELLTTYNLFDENGQYMYNYLFLLDEQIITKIVFSSPLNLLGEKRFTLGYFAKNHFEDNKDIIFNDKQINNLRGKMSAPTDKDSEIFSDLSSNNENNKIEKGIMSFPEADLDYESLVNYLLYSCFNIEISDIIILTSLNLVFLITPANPNIPIFKKFTEFSNKPRKLEKIGEINLNSYYIHSPLFLYVIEDRNLLITQRTTKTSADLVIIDINRDLLFPCRDKKNLEFSVDDFSEHTIKNLIQFDADRNNFKTLKNFNYLKRNELFAIFSDDSIFIINPKSHFNDLSLKMKEKKPTSFTKNCREICENPNEKTGENKFKLLYKIDLEKELKNSMIFSFGSDLLGDENFRQYSNTDWLILLYNDNDLCSYCFNQLYISQKAKEIDTPLTEEEVGFLFKFSENKLNYSLKKYKKFLDSISSYYDLINRKNDEKRDQISLKIKETLLFDKIFDFSPKKYQIDNIYQLVKLIKDLRLDFKTYQLFEMFPIINVIKPKYETDADYFKTQLFPNDKNAEINYDEDMNLPKNKNILQSDLSLLETNLTLMDSAVKKIGLYVDENKLKIEDVFKKIDEKDEEVLDKNQFFSGCEKIGLLNKKFLNKDELKIVFNGMDINHSEVLTLDEYKKFFVKMDMDSVLNNIIHEKEVRKKENIFEFDIEKFVISSVSEKINSINPILEKIKNFYINFPVIEYKEIEQNFEKMKSIIYETKIKEKFPNGFIFLDEFKELINEYYMDLSQDDIEKIFAYFDQNNQNLFIYVRDFIKFFSNHGLYVSCSYTNSIELINEEQFLLILMGIIKKILKVCIFEFGLRPIEFTEKFLLSQEYKKNIFILNHLSTEKIIDKIQKIITNLLPIEQKIFYNYYLDIFNHGILFKDELINLFDKMMEHINESDIFDLKKFDTFDTSNANKYINKQKQNVRIHSNRLEKNYLENLLPVYDITLLIFAHYSQKKNNMKDLNLLYNYLLTIGQDKEYLTQNEFDTLLKKFIPKNVYNAIFSKSLANKLSEYITLLNQASRPYISVSKIILFILNIIKKLETLSPIINNPILLFGNKNILNGNFNDCISTFNKYDILGKELNEISEDYLKIIKDCNFSGIIILNKEEFLYDLKQETNKIDLRLFDYKNYFSILGNENLQKKFNEKLPEMTLKNKDIQKSVFDINEGIALQNLIIPIVKVNVIDTKEMLNLRKYKSGMIENFDYFQPDLQCLVNVTKIRKSFLLEQKSEDEYNLLNHIEHCLKINHYLQNEYLKKIGNVHSFENFPFLRNFGIYTKEILINKKLEEEYYIVNEKINTNDYISLYTLTKLNGGLLKIPEFANSDIAFYIIRYWGKQILYILNELLNIRICAKYFNIRDFYVSYSGRKIKMANLFSYCAFNPDNELFFGPDLYKIFLLLDQLQFCEPEKIPFENLDNIYSRDAFISPELIKNNLNEKLTSNIDSWIFGICLFNILYGVAPVSFYQQLKNWSIVFNKDNIQDIISDPNYNILETNFFYNPFMDIKEIMEDNLYFIKSINMGSFSAITQNKNVNFSIEKNNLINGIGIILDMINACLCISPENRPSLQFLIKCDLFNFDSNEMILCNKYLYNILYYFSPESVIKEKMLLPLRKICCEILRNNECKPFEINNYQNFIYNIIQELNTYLFSNIFKSKKNDICDISNEDEDSTFEEQKQNTFQKNKNEYKYKNGVLVKYMIEHKIVDLLIFLVLRHFNLNLKMFKKIYKKEINKNEEEKNQNEHIVNTMTTNISNIDYYNEMTNNCGILMKALVDFLFNCLQALCSYEHILSLYVENVLLWVIKLFIGEDNQLLGDRCDCKNSKDEVKKYMLLRTFMRHENIITEKHFNEDDLDQVYSILNSNIQFYEIKSYWTPELHYFTNGLFREAFGEDCSGSFKYSVIKNYFLIANNLENEIKDDRIIMDYNFINTEYVNELFTLTEIKFKLRNKDNTNLYEKKNALNYINIVLKSKNENRIRGCLDCKIHFTIQKYLYTYNNDLAIKKELYNMLKEVSLCLIDISEINWLFGNNYEKIYGINKKKNILDIDLQNNKYQNNPNYTLIDMIKDILNQPHVFILYFSSQFLMQEKSIAYVTFIKELGYSFSSSLCLKPLMKSLQNPKESYHTKQLALEIIFNFILSNEDRIISNLEMSMWNFYDILINLISISKNNNNMNQNLNQKKIYDDFETGQREKYFKDCVINVIYTMIEMQNIYIQGQIFNNPLMLRYMEKNKLTFVPKLEIIEIEEELNKIKSMLNFDSLEGKIIFFINAFKYWLANNDKNKVKNYNINIRNILTVFEHVFNIEWTQGLNSSKKNCVIFNFVKLFEWLVFHNYQELLFPKDSESFTSQMFLCLLSKINENNRLMKETIIKINELIIRQPLNSKNKNNYQTNYFGSTTYTLNKIYNYICLKMMNIIYKIFAQKDYYYFNIFNKIQFGTVLNEIFKNQLETISLFLDQENVDLSILENYQSEAEIRFGLFSTLLDLPKKYDDIKMQFLQSDFINFLFKSMIEDNRKFKTATKKIKSFYPLRNEAVSFIDIIFRKYYSDDKSETDCFIFDEVVRNVKVFHLVQNQLAIIKTKIKGDEVLSVLKLFNMILKNNEREIIKIMNVENAKDYFIFALQKETVLKKRFPYIVEYISKVQAGIEK